MSVKQQLQSAKNRYHRSLDNFELDYHKIYDLPILSRKAQSVVRKQATTKHRFTSVHCCGVSQ